MKESQNGEKVKHEIHGIEQEETKIDQNSDKNDVDVDFIYKGVGYDGESNLSRD